MKFIYNISIAILGALLWCLAPFNGRAKLMVRGRKGQDFRDPNGHGSRPTICVHAASLGEFEQGRPLIEALRERYPDHRLVLTFFSPSGYEIRRNYAGVDAVYYLPLDTPRAARRFVRDLAPEAFFLIKYEYWYNILRALRRSDCHIYSVSAIFRPNSSFFAPSWKGGDFFRSMLGFFDRIFVQSAESRDLLASIGVRDTVVVAGDTRFDRVAGLVSSAKDLKSVERFVGGDFAVVCGSTWGGDEELLLALMRERTDWKFIVAPHEIHEERIETLIASSGRAAVRYSQIEDSRGDETLLVVDTIGVLSSIYRYGRIAYIGGGFGVGIHNTLEAATWGVPVVFGPKYEKFREAVGLVECGAARSIASSAELNEAMSALALNSDVAGAAAAAYVRANIGATTLIMSNVSIS